MNNNKNNYKKSNIYKMNSKDLENISGSNMDISFMNHRVICDKCGTKSNITTIFGNRLDANNIVCPHCKSTGYIKFISRNTEVLPFLK